MSPNQHKSANLIFARIASFLVIESSIKIFIFLLALSISIGAFVNYQNSAYDYIEVLATTNHKNPVFSIFQKENIDFDLVIKVDNEQYAYSDLTTPYSIKIPKGDNIFVEVQANDAELDCSLKNGSYYVKGSHYSGVEMERIGETFCISGSK